jgi:hypothetical protein
MSITWKNLRELQLSGLLNFSSSQISISVPELQYNLYNYEPISNKAKAEQNCIPEISGSEGLNDVSAINCHTQAQRISKTVLFLCM